MIICESEYIIAIKEYSNELTTLFMDVINKILINYLINYPEMCIYGLINTKDRKIYLGYTSNLPLALARIVKDIKYSNNKLNKDAGKLELCILETITDKKNLRLRYKFHQNDYSNKGWLLYKRDTKLPTYKLRIDIMANSDGEWSKESLVGVKLITRGYKELTIGVFQRYEEAVEWSDAAYEDKENIVNIVYASNKLTEKFLDKWK